MFKIRKTKICWIGFIAFFLFILFTQIPYFSDDWHWGSYKSLKVFFGSLYDPSNPWHDYPNNGRYLGNFVDFIGSNFFLIRNLIMTGTLCLMIIELDQICSIVTGSADDSPGFILLFAVLLLFYPSVHFAQVIAWNSSFMHYAVPTMLLLIILKMLLAQNENEPFRAVFFIIPFLTALFIENLTIGNVIFILFWIIYRLFRKEKLNINNWMYLIGAVLGLVLMFCDDGYRQVFEKVPDSREMYWHARTGSIAEMLLTGLRTFQKDFVFHIFRGYSMVNLLGSLAIFLACLFAAESGERKKVSLLRAAGLAELMIGAYFFIRQIEPDWQMFLGYTGIFEAVLGAVFLLLIPVIIPGLCLTREQKERMVFIWIFVICIMAPLLLAEPLTRRVFFPAYVIFILLFTSFLRIILDRVSGLSTAESAKWLRAGLAAVFLIGWGFRISIYGVINHYEKERVKFIRYQESVGTYPILLPKLPYENYMIVAWPDGDKWQERYKRFYGLNLDQKYELISFEKWKELSDRQ